MGGEERKRSRPLPWSEESEHMSRALRRKSFSTRLKPISLWLTVSCPAFQDCNPKKKDLSFLPRGRPFTCDFKFYLPSISFCARTSQKESSVVKNIQGKILVERSDKIYF